MAWSRPFHTRKSLIRLEPFVRRTLGEGIRKHVRDRISVHGKGAGGIAVKGYSRRPVAIRADGRGGMKRMVPPVGGVAKGDRMFFRGGYRDYRSKAGLVADRFVLNNRGDLWRDWRVLQLGSRSTPMTIGFARTVNAIAANSAVENERPLLFHIDKSELNVISRDVLKVINDYLF